MGLNGHQQAIGKDQSRFTPRWIWQPCGPFETDAATQADRPWSIGTERNITPAQDSLATDWRAFGRTWLNPPFDRRIVGAFVGKMIEHDHGTLLLHVRTEAAWFRPIFEAATALLFLARRVVFCQRSGDPCIIENPAAKHYGKMANSGAPVVLAAFGFDDADRLDACGIEGAFVPLRFARFVVVGSIEENEAARSWREIVADWLRGESGPVAVAALYRAFQAHPKAQANPNWKAKLRQTLQRGAGRSVGRDQWVAG